MGVVGLLGITALPVYGSVTTDLSPNGDGTYLQWSLGLARYTWVDEAVGCPGDTSASLTETWTKLIPVGDRQSATIDLTSIPNGVRITAVDIIVCQSSTALNGSTLTSGGTFQTFVRLNGADADSGTNITTAGGFTSRTATTQTIAVSSVTKTGATTLEIGVVKTGSGGVLNPSRRSVNVYTLAGNVTYLASDLQVTKADSPDPVLAGQDLTYTLSVTNNGPDAIPVGEDIVIQDTLPAGYAVTASSGDGSYDTGTNEWTISSGLASSATATIQLTVPVPSSEADEAVLSNTAAITSTHPDTDNTNDSDTVTTTVNRSTDLSVTVADAPDPVTAGGSVAYTVTPSRVEVWCGNRRSRLSVSAPFVWRCLTSRSLVPFPHPARRTRRADFPQRALFQRIKPSHSNGWRATAVGASVPTLRRGRNGPGFLDSRISEILLGFQAANSRAA